MVNEISINLDVQYVSYISMLGALNGQQEFAKSIMNLDAPLYSSLLLQTV